MYIKVTPRRSYERPQGTELSLSRTLALLTLYTAIFLYIRNTHMKYQENSQINGYKDIEE